MAAPTLRHTNDNDATLKEKIKAARALIRDERIGEASTFLQEAVQQSVAQQMNVALRHLYSGRLTRSLKVLVCLLKADRYRTEMLRLRALCEERADGKPRSASSDRLNIFYTPLQFVDDPDATFREKLKAGRMLVNEGRVSEALVLLETAVNQGRAHQVRAVFGLIRRRKIIRGLRAVSSVLAAGRQKAELLKFQQGCLELLRYEAHRETPIDEHVEYKVKRTGSPVTVIAFTGLDRRFSVAVYFLERLLGRFGVNLITLYDRHEAFYLAGIPALGADLDETCKSLKRLCSDMGSERIICLGQSSGGYGALRYALELDADHVLAFSPSFVGLLGSPTRQEIAGRTGRIFEEASVDLRRLYGDRDRTPHLEIVYGEENRYDKLSAVALGTIRHASVQALPGVSRHGTLSEAVCSGMFFELMTSAIGSSIPVQDAAIALRTTA